MSKEQLESLLQIQYELATYGILVRPNNKGFYIQNRRSAKILCSVDSVQSLINWTAGFLSFKQNK